MRLLHTGHHAGRKDGGAGTVKALFIIAANYDKNKLSVWE